uniref:Uncharacterized protein n=1 Tax=Candidatus Kentrum sp. TC TaxID=2126339 RepID=A0A450ZTG0_9GAMM|nr:MAG: hypothetical protein BECKTC1821F_GA0114240_101441 [Candidatus Kentron sp. TC]
MIIKDETFSLLVLPPPDISLDSCDILTYLFLLDLYFSVCLMDFLEINRRRLHTNSIRKGAVSQQSRPVFSHDFKRFFVLGADLLRRIQPNLIHRAPVPDFTDQRCGFLVSLSHKVGSSGKVILSTIPE